MHKATIAVIAAAIIAIVSAADDDDSSASGADVSSSSDSSSGAHDDGSYQLGDGHKDVPAKEEPPAYLSGQPAECGDIVKFAHHVTMGIANPSMPDRWKAAAKVSKPASETLFGGRSGKSTRQRERIAEELGAEGSDEAAALREAEAEERRSAPAGWESAKHDVMYKRTGGWDETHSDDLWTDECTIERVAVDDITPDIFEHEYLRKKPVLIRGATDIMPFKRATRRDVLLYCFGDFDVTLSTANKNSYVKSNTTFRIYVDTMMDPQTLNVSGADTKYFFGNNNHEEWRSLFSHYVKPAPYIHDEKQALSFGVGGSGSGVPFHTHGHVFAEVFHGYKRWFLAAPKDEPEYDPNESSLRWTLHRYPHMSSEQRSTIQDCVAYPGELLYIPDRWHHATLNIGQGVFMSTFV